MREEPHHIIAEAVKKAEELAKRQGAYMPALATLLRLHADELADKYPDDANGGAAHDSHIGVKELPP